MTPRETLRATFTPLVDQWEGDENVKATLVKHHLLGLHIYFIAYIRVMETTDF